MCHYEEWNLTVLGSSCNYSSPLITLSMFIVRMSCISLERVMLLVEIIVKVGEEGRKPPVLSMQHA